MKRIPKPLIVLVTLGVIVGLVSVMGANLRKKFTKPPAPPRTVTARTGDLVIEVHENGTIQPVDKVDVRSKVAGRLLTLTVEEGQLVRAGQLIATVDRTLLDPQIAQTQAQLSQAKARLAQAEAGYRLQVVQTRMAIAQAKAGLESAKTRLASVSAGARPQEIAQQEQAVQRAQVALDDALRTQARKQTLVAKGFISQSEADTSQTAVDTARSNLASAQQALSLTQAGPRRETIDDARSQVDAARVQLNSAQANTLQDDVRKADIAQARASVEQIAGNLSQLQVQVTDTRILAPASGIVLKKYRQPGEIVQSATTGFSDTQSLIATLGSRLEVKVGINEVDLNKVQRGALARITVDAVPGATLTGTVTEIAPASSNAFDAGSGGAGGGGGGQGSISKFTVKIALRGHDPRLRPGMSAGVTIESARRKNAVLVPLEAITFTGNQGKVKVLVAGKPAQERQVTLGLRSETEAEVVSGLKASEKIVAAPTTGKRRTINIANGD